MVPKAAVVAGRQGWMQIEGLQNPVKALIGEMPAVRKRPRAGAATSRGRCCCPCHCRRRLGPRLPVDFRV